MILMIMVTMDSVAEQLSNLVTQLQMAMSTASLMQLWLNLIIMMLGNKS